MPGGGAGCPAALVVTTAAGTAAAALPGLQVVPPRAFVPGGTAEMNQQLEYAIRVADYLDLGELMCVDALDRDESCGAHYREDHLDEEGEAKRDDEHLRGTEAAKRRRF